MRGRYTLITWYIGAGYAEVRHVVPWWLRLWDWVLSVFPSKEQA